MAGHLGRIFATEDDKVNCPFYLKMGACRYGDGCPRKHLKPNFSVTVLLKNFFAPAENLLPGKNIDERDHYEDFYEDVLEEMLKFGQVEEMYVTENLGDHLFGNTYIKFTDEDTAEKAIQGSKGRYYAGRICAVEYSPVTDFREGRCRQYEETNCRRGGYCNFLHLRPIPRFARRLLTESRRRARPGRGGGGGNPNPYPGRGGPSRSNRAPMREPPPSHRGMDKRFGGRKPEEKPRRERSPRRERKRSRSRERESKKTGPSYSRKFPIRGTSTERRACIKEWNRERDEWLRNKK